MSAFVSDPHWGWVFVIFALLAIVLFLLAAGSGRWGMWLAGYLCAILALAAAVAAAQARTPPEPERGSSVPAPRCAPHAAHAHAAQPSPTSGVWLKSNRRDIVAVPASRETT